ncbi:MAG: PLP-dependent aminotransferase family protein [Ottowia sp.]|nr:PLP-dependent aminotransferase family protein [Ottowia sp.]
MATPSKQSQAGGVLWDALWAPYRDTSQSLQTQMRHMLVAAILDGVLPKGSYLPSTRALARALNVSRNTVIIVYHQLVDDGYLEAAARIGYVVADVLPEEDLLRTARNAQPATARDASNDVDAQRPPPDWRQRIRPAPAHERNIEKPRNWHEYPYPFLYGQFDGRLFPLSDWRLCCLRALNLSDSYEWGQDGILRDSPALIQQIQSRLLTQRGIQARAEEIIVTIGSQQGLSLAAALLLDTGVRVGMEDPGYPDARNIFLWRQARLTALPVDEQGLVVGPELESQDYVFVTPSHQCPTTVTLSMPRRVALLEYARKFDFVIFEDDYETEDNWGSKAKPALKSLDRDGRVIYLGSLSKSLAPGLRIGYVVAPVAMVQALHRLRRLTIRHPSNFGHQALALFIGMGHYHALLQKLAQVHAERAGLLQRAMQRHLPQCKLTATSGGSAFWVQGPKGLDSRELERMAAREGVLIEPGDVFFLCKTQAAGSDARRYFRMGFTSIESRHIDTGVQALARAFRRLPRAETTRARIRTGTA